jgi:hypothetical protein
MKGDTMHTNDDIYTDEDMYMDDSEVDAKIIRRGWDEYIILNGRILTTYGAPVQGSETAFYYMHENIIRPFDEGFFCEDHCPNPPATPPARTEDLDECFKGDLWPEKAGIFRPDDLVDLYRLLKRERISNK